MSRRTDLTESPAVVTIGTIQGDSRANIVADKVTMNGTIRSFDLKVQQRIITDVRRIAEKIAESAEAKAEVNILKNYPVTMNNEELTERMVPVLQRLSDGKVAHMPLSDASEDFSYFAQQAPGLYVMLGITPPGQDPATAAPNHNPNFFVDERALVIGTRTTRDAGRRLSRALTVETTTSGANDDTRTSCSVSLHVDDRPLG